MSDDKKAKKMTATRPSGSTIELVDSANMRKYCKDNGWVVK